MSDGELKRFGQWEVSEGLSAGTVTIRRLNRIWLVVDSGADEADEFCAWLSRWMDAEQLLAEFGVATAAHRWAVAWLKTQVSEEALVRVTAVRDRERRRREQSAWRTSCSGRGE